MPDFRLGPQPVFSTTAVDFFGPLEYRDMVTVAYKNFNEKIFRTSTRPIHKIVLVVLAEDANLPPLPAPATPQFDLPVNPVLPTLPALFGPPGDQPGSEAAMPIPAVPESALPAIAGLPEVLPAITGPPEDLAAPAKPPADLPPPDEYPGTPTASAGHPAEQPTPEEPLVGPNEQEGHDA
jgi:hypothetical protein